MMLVIDSPYYYAAIIFKNGKVIKYPDILKWTKGKTAEELIPYFKRKGFKLTVMP